MAKKPIEEKHEFIKFIKSLYTDEIQLNFADYFEIITDGVSPIVKLSFPKNQYYLIEGTLDMSGCTNLLTWLNTGVPAKIKINNSELDQFRKAKMGDFNTVIKDDSEYKIELITGTNLVFTKELIPEVKNTNFNFVYKSEIPNDKLDNTLLKVYMKDNIVTFENDEDSDVIFDSPTKSLEMVFKKECKYEIEATEFDDNGFRVVMLEGSGALCKMRQYFKVI